MDESDFVLEDGYSNPDRMQQMPPIPPHYHDPYNWPITPMHEQSFHGRTNSQLASLVESQKQLMAMFKDVTQRIGTLENTVKSLKSVADSVPSSSSSPEGKKRIPSQLTVRTITRLSPGLFRVVLYRSTF